MEGSSPHQVFFLSGLPGAGKWCCHPSRVGEEGRHSLFIMTLPFPEALGTPAEERPQSGPPPHRVCFLQIHYNASFIFPLEFFFSKHFLMCGLILCYISWQPNISPSISWEYNSSSLCCAILPSSVFVTRLSLRKEWIWMTWRCGCLLKESWCWHTFGLCLCECT